MATRRTTRRTTSTGFSLEKLAFWLVIVIGFCMVIIETMNLIGMEWPWFEHLVNLVRHICWSLAMVIPVILSYRYARCKSTGWFVVWIIFAIFIAFGVVSGLISAIKSFSWHLFN